jgi:acetoin:2,6-dichlorophenolindophenol oxidoreductase subunit beta
MTTMKFIEAIRETMRQEMAADPTLFIIGEDVGPYGGEQGVTGDLWFEFGDDRVRDAPIAESSIVGCALGAAMTGCKAIAEIPFGDFLGMCMDQVYNQVAKMRYMSGGQVKVPVVIRTTMGGYVSGAEQHSQSLASWFVHVPGIKVVIPSTPAEAMGLLRSSIRDGNPVIIFEHKGLYSSKGEVPNDPNFMIPLGEAKIVREGTDCTVVATGLMIFKAQEAADILAEQGISIELINPLTLDPLDEETILNSVKKTGHAVVVHETWVRGGYGGEIAALLAEKAINYLDGPIMRVGSKNVPIPFSPILENYVLPQVHDIIQAVEKALA